MHGHRVAVVGQVPRQVAAHHRHSDHADVGGALPGSMGIVDDLHAEGLVLPPVLLRRRGVLRAA